MNVVFTHPSKSSSVWRRRPSCWPALQRANISIVKHDNLYAAWGISPNLQFWCTCDMNQLDFEVKRSKVTIKIMTRTNMAKML